MSQSILLSDLSLSIYSFGYSAGFLTDHRISAKKYQTMNLNSFALLAKDLGFGGIEVPIDKYFPDPEKNKLKEFLREMDILGLKVIFDLENFSSNYLRLISPFISDYGNKFVRVKISKFYGGNRYLNAECYLSDKLEFNMNMDNSIEILDSLDIKLLIENHQDIVVEDILDLIAKYGPERVGVNWDIGNSLPSCETPITFIEKLGKYIGNIHLKDYKIYSCLEGYIMSRCELGKGVIDFSSLLSLLSNYGNIPKTIELGAFNSRMANVNIPEYWLHSNGIDENGRLKFMNYVKENCIADNNWKTLWELDSQPKEIFQLELEEIKNSAKFISGLKFN